MTGVGCAISFAVESIKSICLRCIYMLWFLYLKSSTDENVLFGCWAHDNLHSLVLHIRHIRFLGFRQLTMHTPYYHFFNCFHIYSLECSFDDRIYSVCLQDVFIRYFHPCFLFGIILNMAGCTTYDNTTDEISPTNVQKPTEEMAGCLANSMELPWLSEWPHWRKLWSYGTSINPVFVFRLKVRSW